MAARAIAEAAPRVRGDSPGGLFLRFPGGMFYLTVGVPALGSYVRD